MQQAYEGVDLSAQLASQNIFSVDNLGNQLQSFFEKEKKTDEFVVEQKRLEPVFKLHWLYRLGSDIYTKSVDQLTIHETLWAMGRILFVSSTLARLEGVKGPVSARLSDNLYQMIVYLRQHHDRLRPRTEDIALQIRSDAKDSSSSYYSFSGISYDPLPDFGWWYGYNQGLHGHFDPLMCLVSPSYSSGNSWGFITEITFKASVEVGKASINAASHLIQAAPAVYNAAGHLAVRGFDEAKQGLLAVEGDVSGCCSSAGQTFSHCFSGLGRSINHCSGVHCCTWDCGDIHHFLTGCCHGASDILSGCCGIIHSCGHCRCDDDCGKLFGGCITGLGAAGTWCYNSIKNGCHSQPDHGQDPSPPLHDHSLAKTSTIHSISAGSLFSNSVGTYMTAAYALLLGTPAVYNVFHSAKRLLTCQPKKTTGPRDRKASAKDLVTSSGLGTALFFAGLYIPFGGPHTALSCGILGAHLGQQLSSRRRKATERETYGGFPHKPQKFVPTEAMLEALYRDHEYSEQPGTSLQTIEKDYQQMLRTAIPASIAAQGQQPNINSRAKFLTAQRRLDEIAFIIMKCCEKAFSEKDEVLISHGIITHGLRGFARSYGALFGGHHSETPARKKALQAIAELQQGKIATAQQYALSLAPS